MIDIITIGAGGGSIAWLDEGGALRVGPQSAGAVPGPICYDRGGSNPTLCDSELLCGYLDPERFNPEITLARTKTRELLEQFAARMDLEYDQTLLGNASL